MEDIILKIVVTGDFGAGKTSIIKRYTTNQYSESHLTTIGVDLKIKTVVINGYNIKLQIWDTAGQERFQSITQSFYHGSHGIILVIDDIKDKDSIQVWLKSIDSINPNAKIIIVENKRDLKGEIEIKYKHKEYTDDNIDDIEYEDEKLDYEQNEYFDKYGIKYKNVVNTIRTSAKDNDCIDITFELLIRHILEDGKLYKVKKHEVIDIKPEIKKGHGCCVIC